MARHLVVDRLVRIDANPPLPRGFDRKLLPGTVYWTTIGKRFIRVDENGSHRPVITTGTERT